ncbi:DUF962 domain-containing protein [Undibacterium cyanobacteriorum]|uniref:DUF962 domain-containing protein n=1 Tax=Undibacterium cyanobacteriorum TaxID=3073561 RepID=A0ABY9RDE7_9BURK|nr:Mpo1-like protein [Undibacterium sp. 20NA77.5]WMW79268.1 DUF962 domain-containing protein [Undibacterium sp. 20NA77.5]
MFKLIQWQWREYQDFHANKSNLLIHIFAVPANLAAQISAAWAALHANWLILALSLVMVAASIAVQGIGHKKERNPSIPFSSPWNALSRLMVEQWINFPRYVLSGAWWRAWKQA